MVGNQVHVVNFFFLVICFGHKEGGLGLPFSLSELSCISPLTVLHSFPMGLKSSLRLYF